MQINTTLLQIVIEAWNFQQMLSMIIIRINSFERDTSMWLLEVAADVSIFFAKKNKFHASITIWSIIVIRNLTRRNIGENNNLSMYVRERHIRAIQWHSWHVFLQTKLVGQPQNHKMEITSVNYMVDIISYHRYYRDDMQTIQFVWKSIYV